MEELCEKRINSKGDIRKAVASTIATGYTERTSSGESDRPAVLFIDEVDVFFEKQFFGAIY